MKEEDIMRSIKVMSVISLFISIALLLASCSTSLSGTYVAKDGSSISKIVFLSSNDAELYGNSDSGIPVKYKIKNGSIKYYGSGVKSHH